MAHKVACSVKPESQDCTATYTLNANGSCKVKTTGPGEEWTYTYWLYRCGPKLEKVPQSAEYLKNLGIYNKKFNESELKKTNELRALHGSPPMVIDVEIARSAQYWADNIEQNFAYGKKPWEHSALGAQGGIGCGENMAGIDTTKTY